MNITFRAIGLSFEADVSYRAGCKGRTWGRPEDCYEAEPDEIEFESLVCEDRDASFLLDSSVSDELYDAAMEAARETAKVLADEALIDAYEASL